MDAVGVDGALLISPYSMYSYDGSYALEVYATHPGRFGLIKPFDPQSEAVSDEIAEWAGTPGVVGARIMLTAQPYEADDPGLNRILVAGAKAGIPVNVMSSGKLPLLLELTRIGIGYGDKPGPMKVAQLASGHIPYAFTAREHSIQVFHPLSSRLIFPIIGFDEVYVGWNRSKLR